MSRVMSFSADPEFADQLGQLMMQAGYSNRSMFLRDASLHFAQYAQGDDLATMDATEQVGGTVVIYYQHSVESKLMDLRHSHDINVMSYHHNCLTNNHICVDTMQIQGTVADVRTAVDALKNTQDIDRVVFVLAPRRTTGCC